MLRIVHATGNSIEFCGTTGVMTIAILALAWLAACGWYRLCREMRAASEAIHE